MQETAILIFEFLHFVGLAALVGGLLVELTKDERSIHRITRDGGWTQLATGVVLIALNEPDVNHVKVGVKIAVLVAVVVVLLVYRKKSFPPAAYWSSIGLSVGNIGVAVFW
jgi:hypothetical protein